MSHVVFPIVWAIGLLAFAAILASRMRVLFAAKPATRLDRMPERLRRAFVDGVGQRKFLRGEQPAGISHAFIFWGFVVLLLQVVTLYGRTWDARWHLPGLASGEPLGRVFGILVVAVELIVIVAVLYMLYRRRVGHD